MTEVYRIHNLSHFYSRSVALDRISTVLYEGDRVGLIGPNGAGKTTLVRILCGILAGWRGEVHLHGSSLKRWSRRELAQRVAYVPQQNYIAFPYTAREVVLMGRLPHQNGSFFESRRDREQVERALELTDSLHLAERYFSDLSGGERQLVVLASALAQEPQVLLLDEPTVFLDLKHQLIIYRILKQLNQTGVTLILVSHDLHLAEKFCSRLLVLKEGRLEADLTRADQARDFLSRELIERVFEINASELR